MAFLFGNDLADGETAVDAAPRPVGGGGNPGARPLPAGPVLLRLPLLLIIFAVVVDVFVVVAVVLILDPPVPRPPDVRV